MREDDERQAREAFNRFLDARQLQGEPENVKAMLWEAFSWAWIPTVPAPIHLVLDGPPQDQEHAGRFVDVEDAGGRSLRVGRWSQRHDGRWTLAIHRPPAE